MEIAQRFTDGVVERSPGLVTLRPALEAAAADVAAGPWFAGRFGAGMRALHRGIFEPREPRPGAAGPRDGGAGPGGARRAHAGAGHAPAARRRPVADVDRRQRARARAVARRRGAPTGGRLAPILLVLGLLGLLPARSPRPTAGAGLWSAGVTLAGARAARSTAGWIAARTLTLEGFDTSWGDAVVDIDLGRLPRRPARLGARARGRRDHRRGRGRPARGRAVGAPCPPARCAAPRCSPRARSCSPTATSRSTSPRRRARACSSTSAPSRLLAGRARSGSRCAALVGLAVGVTLASSGPAPAPRARPPRRTRERGVRRARSPRPTRPPAAPRICFASMQDARTAAETAAIPEGATVQAPRRRPRLRAGALAARSRAARHSATAPGSSRHVGGTKSCGRL